MTIKESIDKLQKSIDQLGGSILSELGIKKPDNESKEQPAQGIDGMSPSDIMGYLKQFHAFYLANFIIGTKNESIDIEKAQREVLRNMSPSDIYEYLEHVHYEWIDRNTRGRK